jgi:amino acid transporter
MNLNIFTNLKKKNIGKEIDPNNPDVFKRISLVAFFACIGLGADGLSSLCYGLMELFITIHQYKYLSIFFVLVIIITVAIISLSYSQIVELFPTGGGGYLVGSKLLSPGIGMISGCALLIDYVLTITTSIASGVDAIFSFLPANIINYKMSISIIVLIILIILNLKGVKESISFLMSIFFIFIITHIFIISYGIIFNVDHFKEIGQGVKNDLTNSTAQLGIFGVLFMLFNSFSMGAGTYTGIEAVSNGMNTIKEPKVKNAKNTMFYTAILLAFMASGLIILFLLFNVSPEPGKTLNATAFQNITAGWGEIPSTVFTFVTLLSEALILFVAAQTGFFGGQNILSNMSVDRWFPTRFAGLSDRLVTKDSILLMGITAFVTIVLTKGSVSFMLVLYSISVFITFTISQLGMAAHWWKSKEKIKNWKIKITINVIGFILTLFILISVITVKFKEGGLITLIIIATLVLIACFIKNHYNKTFKDLKRLEILQEQVNISLNNKDILEKNIQCDHLSKTAVILVGSFNGLGLHTLFNIISRFQNFFKNFIFIEVGVIDTGNFKGIGELKNLEDKIKSDIDKYVKYLKNEGYYSEGYYSVGIEAVPEIEKLAKIVLDKFPNSTFFGGQLVFKKESFFSRFLHNYTIFSVQRVLYSKGIPIIIMPIKI